MPETGRLMPFIKISKNFSQKNSWCGKKGVFFAPFDQQKKQLWPG